MTNAEGIGSIEDILNSFETHVRECLNIKYDKPDLFPPALDPAKLKTADAIKNWAYIGRTACRQHMKGIETGKRNTKAVLPSTLEPLELVDKQFNRVEAAAMVDLKTAQDAIQAFNDWKTDTGYLAWGKFVELQEPISNHAKEVAKANEKLKIYQDCSATAKSVAVTLRNQHPRGPDGKVGTVCAGLVDSVSGKSWAGTSGHGQSHPIMTELLNGVVQVEDWPVHVCGEVGAMIQYLNDQGIKEVAKIPHGALFSHAETWDYKAHKWYGRPACGNCGNWLNKIKANRA